MTEVVSVVIPVHRRRRYLAEAIASVQAQTTALWEIVLVDDAGVGGLESALGGCDGRGRVVSGPDSGPGSARNAGIAAATGQWLVCLDEDDRLLPTALEALGQVARQTGRSWAAGRFRYIDAAGRPLERVPRGRFRDGDAYSDLIAGCQFGPPAVVQVRRSAVLEAGGFPDGWRFGEDHALWLRLARDHHLAATSDLVAEYRVHEGQASQDWIGGFTGTLAVLDREAPLTRPGFEAAFRKARGRTALEFGDAWRHHGDDAQARGWWADAREHDPALATAVGWRRLKGLIRQATGSR